MTKVYVHELAGLRPDALATYLAGLGVLRLVGEQRDTGARGFWRNEQFVLVTELEWEDVEKFFLEEYSPTPILAPWNKDGGFFSLRPANERPHEVRSTGEDSGEASGSNDESEDEAEAGAEEAVSDPLLDGFRASSAPRFAALRLAISVAQDAIPAGLRQAEADVQRARDKPGKKQANKRFDNIQDSTKVRLIADLRERWGAEGRQWIDAALALDEAGKPAWASIFGSGGNDGRMEFTKNFRQHLNDLFDPASGAPRENAAAKLRAVLFGGPTSFLTRKAIGQFYPGRAGGTNMGAGFKGDAFVNSWEFILMLEGAVALVAGMSRRGDVARTRVSSPFWVEAAAAGFGTASEREQSVRGEQWLPLWSQPMRYAELVELIREGRAQVSGHQARRAGELVRAAARLGVARGIDSLQRFAYLGRNGRSHLAVLTGRFHVRSRSHQGLLEEIAPWIDSLVWQAKQTKENNVPASLGVIARRTQEALFSVCRREATAKDWRDLLVAAGEAESALFRSGKSPARRPLPRLSPEWLNALDDGTPQGRCVLRLALAFASQHRPVVSDGQERFTDPIRSHFVPFNEQDAAHARFKLDEKGHPQPDPEHVCAGRDLVADAIALVQRRSIWARTPRNDGQRAPLLPLQAKPGCEATLEEVGAWLRCEISDAEVLALVRPLLALDWPEVQGERQALPPARGGVYDPLHLLFRLAYLPFAVPVADTERRSETSIRIRLDPEPLRRLAAADLDGALRGVVRRLEASGLRPVFQRAAAIPGVARRLAASLAFPISREDAARAALLVCKPYAVRGVEEQPAVPV